MMINSLINHSNEKYSIFKEAMLKTFSPVEENDQESTFHFLIGRKIKESTPPYQEGEI